MACLLLTFADLRSSTDARTRARGGGACFRAAREAGGRRAGLAAADMETLYRVPFLVLECPNLKLKKPPWVHMPSAMTVYALVVVSYFLITGGNSAVMGRVGAAEARGGRAGSGREGSAEPTSVCRQSGAVFTSCLPRREVLSFSACPLSLPRGSHPESRVEYICQAQLVLFIT